MKKEELFDYFDKNKERIIEDIRHLILWSIEPDPDICRSIESGLRKLSSGGNKDAAAIYCLIVVYDINAECFSKEIAHSYFTDSEIVERYDDIVRSNFEGILDEDEYIHLLCYPTVSFFGLLEEIEPSGDDSDV